MQFLVSAQKPPIQRRLSCVLQSVLLQIKISNIFPHLNPLWMAVAMPSLDFQRRPAIMPSLASPALGTSRAVRGIQRRRRFSCSIQPRRALPLLLFYHSSSVPNSCFYAVEPGGNFRAASLTGSCSQSRTAIGFSQENCFQPRRPVDSQGIGINLYLAHPTLP